jgi:shikimate dehydrogenase
MVERETTAGNGAIDSRTVMYGVFGDPIGHSKSPLILNQAFQVSGINAAYAAFHIRPGTLKDAVNGIRALGFRGVNVTIPHKVEVMDYLDEIDEGALAIGAVNTIVNEGGRLLGYNTDGIGYVRSLKEETSVRLAGKKVLMLGAGGAARSIVYALAKEGVERISIVNRTVDRAVELAASMSPFADTEGLPSDDLASRIREADIVINTTSAGMFPDVEELPMDPSFLHEDLLVSDLIYNPRFTRLLREAEARGARIHGGLGMFIYQGAYAFEYWTGQPAPAAIMRETVERALAE